MDESGTMRGTRGRRWIFSESEGSLLRLFGPSGKRATARQGDIMLGSSATIAAKEASGLPFYSSLFGQLCSPPLAAAMDPYLSHRRAREL